MNDRLEDPLIEKGRRARVSINDAHITMEHIDQLRQVLNPGVPEKLTRLAGLSGPRRCRVLWIVEGGSEFQHLKTPAVSTYTSVLFANGPRALPLDRQRDDENQG